MKNAKITVCAHVFTGFFTVNARHLREIREDRLTPQESPLRKIRVSETHQEKE